jgi:hypothetical protein
MVLFNISYTKTFLCENSFTHISSTSLIRYLSKLFDRVSTDLNKTFINK